MHETEPLDFTGSREFLEADDSATHAALGFWISGFLGSGMFGVAGFGFLVEVDVVLSGVSGLLGSIYRVQGYVSSTSFSRQPS